MPSRRRWDGDGSKTKQLTSESLIPRASRKLANTTSNQNDGLGLKISPKHRGALALHILGSCEGTKAICHDIPTIRQVKEVDFVPGAWAGSLAKVLEVHAHTQCREAKLAQGAGFPARCQGSFLQHRIVACRLPATQPPKSWDRQC